MSACIRAARSIFPTPGTAACRSMASSGRVSSASRASIACRPAAARRNCWSTAICSNSRMASASRRTKSGSTSNDTVQALIRIFDVAPDGFHCQRPCLCQRHPLRTRARPARRHEMRSTRQHLGDGAGRRVVYAASGVFWARCACPKMASNLKLGRADFRTLFMTATHSVYTVTTKVGPRSEPYMTAKGGAAPRRLPRPHRCSRRRPAARSQALCADHPGPSKRRHHGGRAFADSGAPAHARAQRVVDNVRRLADAAARARCRRHPRLFIVEPARRA